MNNKRYNDLFVKKVTPVTSALNYQLSTTQNFPQIPVEAVVVDDTLVDKYDGEDLRAFMHHSTLGRYNDRIYIAHTVHNYDEDASGMYVSISYSEDNGATWSILGKACPEMSDVTDHGIYPSQWSYPSIFLNIPSGFYLLMSAVNGLSELENYQTLGALVRKINPNNTLGDLEWVYNGETDSRVVPTPISSYPSYNFASESLIDEVITYISQPMYRPKILFGWNDVWSTQEDYYLDSSTKLREPTEIYPYNYDTGIKCWKSFQVATNIFQIGEDNTTQVITNIPDANPTARRWLNWSPEIIISAGNTSDGTRSEIGLFIWRKNNSTGIYELNNGDAYSLSSITKTTPVWAGFAKNGGEQLPYINRYGKNQLEVAMSVSKEEIYYRRIDISKLV